MTKKTWWILGGASVLVLAAVLASRPETPATSALPSSSSTASTSASSTSSTSSATVDLESADVLYQRTIRDRAVRVTRAQLPGKAAPMYGAFAKTGSGKTVSVVLLTPLQKLDKVAVLEAPEVLSGMAFDGECGISLSMYVGNGKDARACADALDPSKDLGGKRESVDLAKFGAAAKSDTPLFADTIDFDDRGVPMRLLRIIGVVDDVCVAMHAQMKADTDRQLNLVSRLAKDLSIKAKP